MPGFRAILRGLTPPVVAEGIRKVRRSGRDEDDPDQLFDGQDALFKEVLLSTAVYGEYGCGKSTVWVLENTDALVYTVDTDREWIARTRGATDSGERLKAKWVDVGEVGAWGRPVSYSARRRFEDYCTWIWTQEPVPDTVLIDGRFRVNCFLTSLQRANPGTRLLFDDYGDRPHYHIAEEFIQPVDHCGRQSLFEVPAPGTLDSERILRYRERFMYVMD